MPNNQHRRQIASAAKAALTKQDKSCEKDVDALTFMQTVVMSFVRGMEYGEQTLPVNDLFVHFPVQLVPALVTAMEQQRFASVEVKGGCGYRCGYRLCKQGEEDNPLLDGAVEELRTETMSFASSSVMTASAASGEVGVWQAWSSVSTAMSETESTSSSAFCGGQ